MGIRGLSSFLFWSSSRDRRSKLSEWSGKRIGVDILCLLYRSRSVNLSLLHNLSHFLAEARLHKIELIIVFDGSPPPEKAQIMATRKKQREDTDKLCSALESALEGVDLSCEQRDILQDKICSSRKSVPQIRAEDRDAVKQLLYATGTPFVHSLGEADALLAYMEYKGEIDAVVSTDYDFLARGVKNLLVPSTENLQDCTYHNFALADICNDIGLTITQFREFACLLGTDYAPGIGKYTSRLLYRRYKLCGSIETLMNRMRLAEEKKQNVRFSLQELDISRKTLDDLLRPDQQEKLAKGGSVEPDWITRHLALGEVGEEIRVFLA